MKTQGSVAAILFTVLGLISVFGACAAETQGSEHVAITNYNGLDLIVSNAQIINVPPTIFGSPEITEMELNGYLILELTMKNTSSRPVNYRSTGSNSGPGSLSLDDEFGGHYYRINADGGKDVNLLIYPGESGTAAFTFQKPSPTSHFLTLSFPKYNLFGEEEIRGKTDDDLLVKLTFDTSKITVKETTQPVQQDQTALPFSVSIVKARIGTWKVYSPMIERQMRHINEEAVKQNATLLAITYALRNDTETKKLDLGSFSFSLSDEFANHYERFAEVPYGFNKQRNKKVSHSLYPGETTEETVFFEVPVQKAATLTLTIQAFIDNEQQTLTTAIPTEEIIK